MPLLDDVKLALRIDWSELDGEVTDLIDAAKADLIISGVAETRVNDDTDPLIKRAIIVYCKANDASDHRDAERWGKSYDMLKQHLSLASDYNGSANGVVS